MFIFIISASHAAKAAIVAYCRASDDGISRGDDAEEIRPDDVTDWSRGVRYRHPNDYVVAVDGHDNAVRDTVLDCAHLLDLQLLRSDRTV